MSFVRKTIAATIVSGVALMGAAGTASAATVKPKPGTFTAYGKAQSSKHWTQKVSGKASTVTIVKGKKTTVTSLTGLAYNKTLKTYQVKVVFYYKAGKKVFLLSVKPNKGVAAPVLAHVNKAAHLVTIKVAGGNTVPVKPVLIKR
jgi:hypothetical protein